RERVVAGPAKYPDVAVDGQGEAAGVEIDQVIAAGRGQGKVAQDRGPAQVDRVVAAARGRRDVALERGRTERDCVAPRAARHRQVTAEAERVGHGEVQGEAVVGR